MPEQFNKLNKPKYNKNTILTRSSSSYISGNNIVFQNKKIVRVP